MANPEDLEMLKSGAENWNAWRKEKGSSYRPNIEGHFFQPAHLLPPDEYKSNFDGYDFSNADLSDQFHPTSFWNCSMKDCDFRGSKLHGAIFIDTNLEGSKFDSAQMIWANLRGAKCSGANFTDAVLEQSELTGTDMCACDLTGVRMQRSIISGTNFRSAILRNCQVAGVSTWDVRTDDKTIQEKLDISTLWWNQDPPLPASQVITVDDIEVAQYVHILINNKKIRNLVDVGSAKTVLILGRFSPPNRKAVLDELRVQLRARDLVPMIFDFERPQDRDFTETVQTLASMSRFVISDLTLPRSNPLELQAAVPNFKVPVVPILDVSVDKRAFAMFQDLKLYPWVLPLLEYKGKDDLMDVIDTAIIARANEVHAILRERKSDKLKRVSTSTYRQRPS